MSRNESSKDVDFLVEDLWLEYKVEFLFVSWHLRHIRCSGALPPPYTYRMHLFRVNTATSQHYSFKISVVAPVAKLDKSRWSCPVLNIEHRTAFENVNQKGQYFCEY